MTTSHDLSIAFLLIVGGLISAMMCGIGQILFLLLRRKKTSQGFPVDPRAKGNTE